MAGRTTALLLMVILPLLSPSIASGQSPLSEKHPSPPVTPREQTVLNIVYGNISVSAAPLWITQRAGIFQKHGFDARLSFARGTLATQAVIAGSFPVAILSPPSVVNSVLAGTRIKMVCRPYRQIGIHGSFGAAYHKSFSIKGEKSGNQQFWGNVGNGDAICR